MLKKLKLFLLYLFFTTSFTHAQWDVQLYMNNFSFVDKIQFINETHGWAIGNGVYLYTTNGGETWNVDPDWINTSYGDIFFVNQDSGFVTAPNGIIRKTLNGGQTWRNIQTSTEHNITRLFFVDENFGWAALDSYAYGQILRTLDGGEAWEILETGLKTANVFFFVSITEGWCIGVDEIQGKILKTNNGGNSFNIKYICNDFTYFHDIYASQDNQRIWAVGAGDYDIYLCILSNNGGETWEEQNLPLLKNRYGQMEEARELTAIQFINDTLGWITGRGSVNSYVLLTTDGGESWFQQNVENHDGDFRDICMITPKKGWIAGRDYIYTTNHADTVITVGIVNNVNVKPELVIYPNPFKDRITIELPLGEKPSKITISGIDGTILLHEKYPNDNILNLNFLSQGIYYLTVYFDALNSNNSLTTKIIKL